MDLTEYPAVKLKEMAQVAAREKGGRLVRWSIMIMGPRIGASSNQDTSELRVYYRPRHWRYCRGCQDATNQAPHVGPKGEAVQELAFTMVAL